jgi:hypothetical protein
MALRLSGQILLGASRIYWRKARYLLDDCSETLDRLKLNFKADGQVDMPQDQSRAPISSITLATNYTAAANNLMLQEPDLDLDEILNMVSTQQPQINGKPTNGKDNDISINLKEKFNMNKSFGFDKSQNDSLLQAFPMNEDFEIETGRRLTDTSALGMSRDSNPFISRDSISTSAFGLEDPSGIEVGRRELSIASAFSPMRLSTPGKLVNEGHNDFDMNDNFTWDTVEEQSIDSPLAAGAPFNTPPRPVAAKASRKRKVALDEVTELSSTQIQKQVKDTSDIVTNTSRNGKRAAKNEVAVAIVEESRRLSMTSSVAHEDAAAILARPAFDGDMIMDAFGDLFKDNPLSVLSVIATPAISRTLIAQESEFNTPNYESFATEMNEDHIYEDMNPEPVMPSFFETEPMTNNGESAPSQINLLEVISASTIPISFNTIVSGQRRSTVAKSFFDVLAFSSKGMIRAEQSEAFGQINLTAAS